MTLTADQYFQLAVSYDEAAADPSIAPDNREAFARKADWFRFLSKRKRRTSQPNESQSEVTQTEYSLPTPRRSLRPFLTTLWLAGAGIYLMATVLFSNTVTETDSEQERSPSITETKKETARLQPAVQPSNARETVHAITPSQPAVPTQETAHAITPNQPPYEAPGLMVPPSAKGGVQNPTSQVGPEQASSPLPDSQPEILRVTASTTIRNGPAPEFKAIGTARPGAELQIRGREKGWVQFVDPESGNSGWIESRFIGAAPPAGEHIGEPTSSAETPRVEQAKPKAVKNRVRNKPSEQAQVAKRRSDTPSAPARNRAQANLPDDEAFIHAPRPPRGFFARRRMLREGLLSPGFNPPR